MQTPSPSWLRERVPDRAAEALRRTRAKAQSQAGPALSRLGTAAKRTPDRATHPATVASPPPAPTAPLLDRLLADGDLEVAVLAQVRTWADEGHHDEAAALAEALRDHEATRVLGDLASGVAAFHRGYPELAWDRLAGVPRGSWTRHAPEEYVRCGLHHDRDGTVAVLRTLVAEAPREIALSDWLTLDGVLFGAREHELANEVLDLVDRLRADHPNRHESIDRRRNWLDPWVRTEVGHTTPRHERPVFAVMDYGHPGMSRGSANIGDHVQSIASLGHLVRHQGVRFQGEEGLVSLLQELAARTRPELRLREVEGELDVLTIHRDASMHQEIPEGTWTLCFGWFMHQMFRERYGFPLHDALRPLFVSFHCNKRDLLTDEAIAYLKKYGPVGCRDWTTVYLLLSAGVPAFFSGCLTTTISTVFPPQDPAPSSAPVGYVDVPASQVPAGAPTFAHSDRAVRRRSFLENCDDAVRRLETYRSDLSRVVTSRLHAYLPLRSLGVPVDFRPANLSDIRFDGLQGITDEAFDAMRSGLLDLLRGVFTLILSGAPEDEVYARWRELTADRVAEAERKLHAPGAELPAPPAVLAERVAEAVARTRTVAASAAPVEGADAGEPVHVAVPVTKADVSRLQPLVRSLRANTTRPLHVWVLGRMEGEKTRTRLAGDFPDVTFSWVRTGRLDAALPTRHPLPNTLARLLLPQLLPGVPRVVVVPPATVVEGDVAELAGLDLGGHAFAAARNRKEGTSGFHLLHDAAARLGRATDLSSELRRTAHAKHAFDFDAFHGDLLVIDLPAFAEQVPAGTAVGLMERYGLRTLEVLHLLVGPDRAEIPDRWQHVPTEDAVAEPLLIRWRGGAKPWNRTFVPERERWRALTARELHRSGA